MDTRKVLKIYDPVPASDGAGVRLLRAIGSNELNHLDPFLLLDEFKSDNADDYIAGFPSHPHRGFETVTYMLAGVMRHKDSTGESGDLHPGAVQWMTAGRGIVHSEMPIQKDGLIWGFQLWVNLPASEKMRAPRYQNIAPEDVPLVKRDDGVTIKVIAGEVDGVKGAASDIITDPLYIDITIPPGGSFTAPVPQGHNAFAYGVEGSATFGEETLSPSRLATFGDGGQVTASAGKDGARFLLLAAKPIREAIVRHGPFVMNTHEEITEAIEDYRTGKF